MGDVVPFHTRHAEARALHEYAALVLDEWEDDDRDARAAELDRLRSLAPKGPE